MALAAAACPAARDRPPHPSASAAAMPAPARCPDPAATRLRVETMRGASWPTCGLNRGGMAGGDDRVMRTNRDRSDGGRRRRFQRPARLAAAASRLPSPLARACVAGNASSIASSSSGLTVTSSRIGDVSSDKGRVDALVAQILDQLGGAALPPASMRCPARRRGRHGSPAARRDGMAPSW